MNCTEIDIWISAYQDGELDGLRQQTVKDHLADCPGCRALFREWAALAREVRDGRDGHDAPVTLHGRVMRQISAPKPARAARAGYWWTSRRWGLSLAPAVGVLLWVLGAPHLVGPLPRPTTDRGYLAPAAPTIIAAAPGPSDAMPDAGQSRRPPLSPVAPRLVGRRVHREGAPPLLHPRTKPVEPNLHSRREPARSYPEMEPRRLVRRLRAQRWRCLLAEVPHLRRGHRVRRRRVLLALGPWTGRRRSGAPPPALAGAGRPQVTIVDYVLPEVPAQLPAADEGAEFVMRSADPALAADREVNL